MGDIKFIGLTSNEFAINKGFAIKTYNITNATHNQEWRFSSDGGTTWASTGDGYETEMNINWFYNGGVNTTQTLFMVEAEDSSSNKANSSVSGFTWNINATNNYAPIVAIINPQSGDSVILNVSINFTVAEPNDDTFLTNITIDNKTDTINISFNLAQNINNISYNFSLLQPGNYNLTVQACENATTDLLCGTAVNSITVSAPVDTPTQEEFQNFYVILFSITLGLLLIGYKTEDPIYTFLSGIMFLNFSLMIWNVGYFGLDDNYLRQLFSAITGGIGAYIIILSSMEMGGAE